MVPQTNTNLWLVIPCYNEESRLQIRKFTDAVSKFSWLNLCFVDDGSNDKTLEILDGIKGFDRINIISNPQNMGKAESVRAGILHGINTTNYNLFGYWDADLATPFTELEPMYNQILLKNEIMLVMGARVKILGKDIIRKKTRHYLGRFFATLACIILDVAIYDTQCGAKIFTREFAKIGCTDKLITNWCFDIELLIRLQKYYDSKKIIEKKVIEYPLNTWIDVDGSKIKLSHFYRIGKDLLKLLIMNRFR